MAAALQPVPNARRVHPELTQARLKELLHYDPETGVFTWIAAPGGRKDLIGRVAGAVNTPGYVVIRCDDKLHLAHRLAWLYVNGEWPSSGLDHINRTRTDNRISNLRVASQHQNGANTSLNRNNKSGVKGVSWSGRRNKWLAQITVNRENTFLGYFSDRNEAAAAYAAAAKQRFGDFAHVAHKENA